MSLSNHIVIEWVGIRKDANKGSFWGYFTPVGQPDFIIRKYDLSTGKYVDTERYFYSFSGKIGKSIALERGIITDELFQEIDAKKKNFREVESEKFLKKCGSVVLLEFEMQASVMRMRGEITEPEPEKNWWER